MTALNSRLYRSASRSLRRHVTGKATCQNSLQPITTTTRLAALQGAPRTTEPLTRLKSSPDHAALLPGLAPFLVSPEHQRKRIGMPCMHACPVDSFAISLPLTCQTVPPSVPSVVRAIQRRTRSYQ